MKNKVKLLAGVSFVMLTVAAVCYTTSPSKEIDPWLERNVEALTQTEITVGTLCMVCPNYACSSLGEVFEEHHAVD